MKKWEMLQEKGYLSSLLKLERESNEKLEFHGAFVPAVAESLIMRLTEPGDWIWDPFAGSGTTGDVAKELERHCFMSDLNPTSDEIAKRDARDVIEYGAMVRHDIPPTFNLVILHPPYHNIIKFSDDEDDLSNCSNVEEFLCRMSEVGRNCWKHVKDGGYIALVIGDVWLDGEVFPLGHECMRALYEECSTAKLKAIQIKNIEGHARHRRGQENLWLSRHARWGSVTFDHEYIFSIQKR